MTVAKLKRIIKNLPDNMDVVIKQTDSEFEVTPAEAANISLVTFSDGKLKAKETCLLITDEI